MDNLELLPGGGDKPLKKKASAIPAAADTLITPKGNIVTRAEFNLSAKNGLPFTDMKAMGDFLDSWARKIPDAKPQVSQGTVKAQAIIQPVVPTQKKKDFYEGNGAAGSGGMRYHQ